MDRASMSRGLLLELRNWLDDTRAMLALVSRIPVTTPPPQPRALRALPLAGAIAGSTGGAMLLLAILIGLPAMAAALVAIATLVAVGGALHEDGLADVADGFGGGHDRDAKLQIMRDSRIGTFGALALVLSVMARVVLVSALVTSPGTASAALALVAVGAISRAGIVYLLCTLPAARSDGLGHSASSPPRLTFWHGLAAAAAVSVLTLLPGAGFVGLAAALAGAAAATYCVGVLARRQIGGQTGDVCGAAQQAGEIAALAALVIAA